MVMKKAVFIILVLIATIYFTGCAKKDITEELQEPMSMEALSNVTTSAPATAEVKVTVPNVQVTNQPAPVAAGLEPLPPAGTAKPTAIEIQTALKNAGLYTGVVDGKIGPMTKKAIQEFQKTNSLQVDGKVGPKTWEALSKYLNPQPTKATRKR